MVEFYNKNIKEELGICDYLFFDEWYGIVENILLNEEFQKRKLFKHHKNKTVFIHSIEVSYSSFMAAKYFNADERVCAIAGLLHDFYPKAWLYNEELADLDSSYLSELTFTRPLFQQHGFTHAKQAYENCLKYFPNLMDNRIKNCIIRHMFPMNICPPKYKEAWIITLMDKKNSLFELSLFDLPAVKSMPKKIGNKISYIVKRQKI